MKRGADSYDKKVAIVTGGGSGLGAALASELASRGARVVVADINEANAKVVAGSIGNGAEARRVDVSNGNQVEELVSTTRAAYGSLDLIFNNAGTSSYGETTDVSLAEWERVLKVNLWGVILGAYSAYAVMKEQRAGKIINIGSGSVFTCDPLFGPYVTSKYGVVGFSRVLALEAEAYGIQVSVVCPGNIRTPMLGLREPSWITPAIPAPAAARRILDAVARGKKFIVFPLRWRLIWLLDRLHPSLLNPLRRVIVRRAHARNEIPV